MVNILDCESDVEGSTPSDYPMTSIEDVLEAAKKAKGKIIYCGPGFPRWRLWNKKKRFIKSFINNYEACEYLKELIK